MWQATRAHNTRHRLVIKGTRGKKSSQHQGGLPGALLCQNDMAAGEKEKGTGTHLKRKGQRFASCI